MAKTPSPVRGAISALVWLLIIAGAIAGLNLLQKGSWSPKLALDLEGGTQIILTPQLQGQQKPPTQEQLNQAVSIIRQRVDAAGVSESEVNTQGNSNIVVSIPGKPDRQTLARIEESAKLDFRPVIYVGQGQKATKADKQKKDAAASAAPTASPSPTFSDPTPKPTNESDDAWLTPQVQEEYQNYKCDPSDLTRNEVPANQPLVTCDSTNAVKYVLGPVALSGSHISDASASLGQTQQGAATNEWGVNLSLDSNGAKVFKTLSERLVAAQQPKNQFAVVVDGRVLTAPSMNAVITDGKSRITGQFTQASAQTLADQLKFGALPIGFKVQSNEQISATLGSSQLAAGLLAGLIGLLLVVVYSLIQYRALGLVTIASLVIAAGLTYLLVTYLSSQNGYRLSLAGVAGLIVAIGITADSFIVYFERIKDELREGRPLQSAIEVGWRRAIRTILASDTVNFLAAVVLFILAVGNVRGFALTLGLTTLIDLLIVVLFTHPMLRLLARMPFFADGHPLSGLDPKALGAVYRGRGQFRTGSVKRGAQREALKRQTIAERKAAEAAAKAEGASRKGDN